MDDRKLEVAHLLSELWKEWAFGKGPLTFYDWLSQQGDVKLNEKWVPGEDERYFFITSVGVSETIYTQKSSSDREHVRIGNCYKTLGEAGKHIPAVRAAYTADV